MMPVSAELPVLYHCLAKTGDLQLGTLGHTLWSRAGRPFRPSATSWALRGCDPQGLPPRRIVCILLRVPPILSSPAGAVADPGDNSHLDHLTGHRICHPALGGFSPPDPAVLQCSIHLVASTTCTGVFPRQFRSGLSLVSHICSALHFSAFSFFPQGRAVLWPSLF